MSLRLAFVIMCMLAVATAFAQVAGFKLDGTAWTYADGSWSIHGVLFKPDGDGPFPAVLISHGKGGAAEPFARTVVPELVKHGLVCIAVEYTHAVNGTAGTDGASTENLKRAKKALEILRSLKYVDSARLVAYGHSMGAFVTIGLAAEPDAKLKAAVITAGGISGRTGFPAPDADVARKIRVPFLILHGEADTTVPPERSLRLKEILDEQKVSNERKTYPGEGHNINRTQADDVRTRMLDWLRKQGLMRKGAVDRCGATESCLDAHHDDNPS